MTKWMVKPVLLAALAALCFSFSSPTLAAPTPSKTTAEAAAARAADMSAVKAFVAREDVSRALASAGLTQSQVDERLARLSDQDLRALSAKIQQVQAAGTNVPNYIWILLAIFLGVLILSALF